MNYKELNSLYLLDRHIKRLERRIGDLEGCSSPKSPISDGMPRAPSYRSDPTGNAGVNIADEKNKLEGIKKGYESKKAKLEAEIYSLDDELIKAILLHRFVDLMSWRDVAQNVGGGNTTDSVKKMCYRFLKKC